MTSANPLSYLEIQNGQSKPAHEPARAVRYALDFTAAPSYALDFSPLQDLKRLSVIECVYVDNSNSTVPIVLSVDIGQTVEVEPGQYGYYNLLFGYPARLSLSSPGNGLINLFVLNVNLFGSWKKDTTGPNPQPVTVANLPTTQAVSGTVAVSNLPLTQPVSGSVAISNLPTTQAVADATLESVVSGGKLQVNFPATQPVSGSLSVSNFPATQPVSGAVNANALWSGGTVRQIPRANLTAVQYVGSGVTTSGTLLSGSPGYFVQSVMLSMDARTYCSSANVIYLAMFDSSSGNIMEWLLSVPTAAPTLALANSIILKCPPDFFWNNKTANSSLSCTLSTALSSGGFFVTVNYGTASFVG